MQTTNHLVRAKTIHPRRGQARIIRSNHMTAQIFVKPAAGRQARHETTHQPLRKRGAYWPNNAYTRRLLQAGDIEVATAPGAQPKAVVAGTADTTTEAKPRGQKKRLGKH
jgi:hypothetical protein